jgi:hypothetical protein
MRTKIMYGREKVVVIEAYYTLFALGLTPPWTSSDAVKCPASESATRQMLPGYLPADEK